MYDKVEIQMQGKKLSMSWKDAKRLRRMLGELPQEGMRMKMKKSIHYSADGMTKTLCLKS